MKKLLLATIFVLTSIFAFSQVANYSYTATTSTWSNNSGTTLIGNSQDDAISSATPIGFNFIYDGVTYAQFKASSNGFITFNNSNVSSQSTNNLTNSIERVILAVLWDDNKTGLSGNVNYKLTGTSPNRVLTIEWIRLVWSKTTSGSNNSGGTINCQIKLYETTNIIEYIYDRVAATGTTYALTYNPTSSIGLGGGTSGDFLSLSDIKASPYPTSSSITETSTIGTTPFGLKTGSSDNNTSNNMSKNNVTARIGSGTKYRFGPPPTIITNGSFSAFTSCSGYVSTEQSYTVSGFGLTADIVVTAPTGFELSTTSGGVFSSSVTLVQSSGVVNSKTIFG
jgi:hypothetical protein